MSAPMNQDPYGVKAIIEKPVKYAENIWGKDIRIDRSKIDYDVSQSFFPKVYGRERMHTGSLPLATSPKLRRAVSDRMVSVDTRVSRACWNEALAQSGPFYLRHWQIWDSAPILPHSGDVTIDPKYGASTRRFTQSYRSPGK